MVVVGVHWGKSSSLKPMLLALNQTVLLMMSFFLLTAISFSFSWVLKGLLNEHLD